MFWLNEHFDAAGDPRLAPDESGSFEGQHHLVNRRRADAKILLHVGFGRRPAMQPRVEVDKGPIQAALAVISTGVGFIDQNEGGPGVRFRKPRHSRRK